MRLVAGPWPEPADPDDCLDLLLCDKHTQRWITIGDVLRPVFEMEYELIPLDESQKEHLRRIWDEKRQNRS